MPIALHFGMVYAMVKKELVSAEGEPVIKVIRELLGMSQFQFAVLVGVTPSTVSRWEQGKGTPAFTPEGFRNLLNALKPHDITLEDLPGDLGAPAGQ